MAYAPLSLLEREEIRVAIVEDPGVAFAVIAARISRDRSTVSREVSRNGGRNGYCATRAQQRSDRQRCRPRECRLVADLELRSTVTADLAVGFSPVAIAVRLAQADGPRVCAETIYQAVYGQRLDVHARECLRSRRPRRRRRSRHEPARQHPLAGAPSIHERPATVEPRVQPGHWEGDLIIGARNQSAMITLIERVTRITFLAELPCGYNATECLAGLCETFDQIPAHLRKTLTWDRGSEMADWALLADAFDLGIYFADPHSPWQRGLNEQNNRLLRWWLPRGIDLGAINRARCDEILNVVNHQPRRSLGYDTPAQRYDALTVH